MKNLGSLAITSLLGTLAIAYTAAFMGFRLFEGSYLAGGCFHAALTASKAAVPAFAAASGGLLDAFQMMASRAGTFVLLAMSGAAYCAHQNAPVFFEEAGRDLGKFRTIVAGGFGLAMVLNIAFLFIGFSTFGAAAAGNILKNYAKTDILATIANGLYGGSVIATYPLIYVGMKPILKSVLTSIKSLNFLASDQALNIVPLALVTATAVAVSDAGIVNAVAGAVCGASLIYILPALMYLKQADKNAIEKVGNVGLLAIGIVMGVLGVYTSLAPR
jgi:amino acid permease